MPFRYSCFVSYRHGRGRLMQRFNEQLVQALTDYIEPWLDLPVFSDRDGLQGGDLYHDRFIDALVHSVCMVAVLTPTYFDLTHTYCAREYRAMELIETERFTRVQSEALKQRGLIIPIVLKGAPPEYVHGKRDCRYDFSRFTLRSGDLSEHESYVPWFEEIGEKIQALHQGFIVEGLDPDAEAATVTFPTTTDVVPVIQQIVRGAGLGFPGRGFPPEAGP